MLFGVISLLHHWHLYPFVAMIAIISDMSVGHANQLFIIDLLYIIHVIVLDVVLAMKVMLKECLEVDAADI